MSSADARNLTALGQTARTVDAEVSHLAALTADNPHQRARVTQLRQDAAGVLAALGARVEATQAPRSVNPTDAEAQRTRMDSARRTLQAMRTEENRLLADRVQEDQAAVRRLQFISMALAAAASGFLAWIFWLIARSARRQRQGTDTLRQANENLEAQVDASAADLRDSNARLRSIIDSAVDGIIVIDGHGRIEAFNPGAERLFGYPAPEVMGRNVKMLMPSPYHDEHDGYLDRYLHTGHARIIGTGREVTGRRRDGSTFPLHLSVGEMAVKGERKFTGILHDLSKARAARGELRCQRGALAIGHRFRRGRHRRDRRARPHRSLQSGGGPTVRVRGGRGCRPQRQHVDAVALSRGTRYVSRAPSRDREQKIIGTGREVGVGVATARRFRCICRSER